MELIQYKTAQEFLKHNQSYLEKAEVTNSLLLGLSKGFQQDTGANTNLLLLSVRDKGKPLLCGLQTPGRNLILYGTPNRTAEVAVKVKDFLREKAHPLPGFIGPREVVRLFTQAWCGGEERWRVFREMSVYRLTQLSPVPAVPGNCRPARSADLSLVVEWMTAFSLEALGEFDPQGAIQNADQLIGSDSLFIWEDDRPVSMTAVGRPTRHGITIYYVYTPPELRKKGYATACVAEVSNRMLAQGFRFCTLFADLANPTSNKIYREMGYQFVEDFIEVKLET